MSNNTKHYLLAAVVASVLGAPAAASAALYNGAFNTGPNPPQDGVLGNIANPLTGFDFWNNASATFFKINANGTETQINPGAPGQIAVGDTIRSLYQGQVNVINGLLGPIASPNLAFSLNGTSAGTYQITGAASWLETVTAVTANQLTAQIVPVGGAKLSLFYDSPGQVGGSTQANVALGTGFTDGLKFLEADILPGLAGGITTYSIFNLAPPQGAGGGTILASTNLVLGNIALKGQLMNPDFNGKHINGIDINFTTQFGTPGANASQTVNFFDNANGYLPIAVNPLFVLQADANSFITVPEPESLALFGIGLLGVALSRRRKHSA